MIISLIAAVDEAFGLGKDNQLLCHLPADLKHFKSVTFGKPIIMGHKTYNSIGKPLPGRHNIVLSRQTLAIPGVTIAHSMDEALSLAQSEPEIMIIGGATVYAQSLDLADRIYLTVIHHQFNADVFFPTLNNSAWNCQEILHQAHDEINQYNMTFYRYDRVNKI